MPYQRYKVVEQKTYSVVDEVFSVVMRPQASEEKAEALARQLNDAADRAYNQGKKEGQEEEQAKVAAVLA